MSKFTKVREKIVLKEMDENAVNHICSILSIPYPLARTLVARNIKTFEEAKSYFRPSLSNLHNPFLFSEMEKSVRRIEKAIKEKEKIAIYGDYDVDGVTATVIMVKVLRQLGANCIWYLPHRISEGYGLSKSGIKKISEQGATLIITVDCGITSIEEVKYALSLGIDVIISDHHEVGENKPPAFAIINPKDPESGYPYRELAGVGVALKLCLALCLHLKHDENLCYQYLDLVALGTIADIVPLTGENRIIAALGLQKLQNTTNKGLKQLIVKQSLLGKNISTYEVGFMIAPCINATGRLGDSNAGINLLMCEDEEEASKIADYLCKANHKRRQLDNNIAEEACEWVEKYADPQRDFAFVIGNCNWHVGVIGIVASRLVERYFRPTIIFSEDGEGYARGSGRSIPNLHLCKALNRCSNILESFGGHAAAAGMVIKKGNIELFREKFNETVKELLSPEDFTPVIMADAELSISSITPKYYRIIKQMEPFGPANPAPIFISRNLQHQQAPRLVGNNHLKMCLKENNMIIDAIAFNMGKFYNEIKDLSTISVAYNLDENEWNGKTNLQMKIKGFTL
ncbi:MAG: single-stranded-DNA-specific exonuclease RecJ [Chitinispirillaceae bacterium]|nr:single-stranded-DNA-specific exonuclease RecJ [Chitinispirillaceae bacterium]